jgi:hypothetical protein
MKKIKFGIILSVIFMVIYFFVTGIFNSDYAGFGDTPTEWSSCEESLFIQVLTKKCTPR